MKVVAVIPCYNEEQFIGDIVTRTRQYVSKVIVANDGSTDRTALLAQEAGAVVVHNVSRQGFGSSMILGLDAALRDYNPDIIVTLDGDGQHNPDEIPLVVEPIDKGEADLVIGSRFIGDYSIKRYRKFGIGVITLIYNIWSGHHHIKDSQSCLRAYSRELLDNIIFIENGFGFSTEILIKARAKGYRIKEVPISCIYHEEFGMNSTMNPVKHGLDVAWRTFVWRWKLRNGGKRCSL